MLQIIIISKAYQIYMEIYLMLIKNWNYGSV